MDSSDTQRHKWDTRYQQRTTPDEACWLLQHCQHLLPEQGDALDLACGTGGNAILLAERGLSCQAWDISGKGLQIVERAAEERGLPVTTRQRDVEAEPPEPGCFDVIVVSHFLHRPTLPALARALKRDGLLFYQTFNQLKPSDKGPGNPDYLLAANELLRVFPELQVLFYREDGVTGDPQQGLRQCSYFVGQRTD